MCEKGAVEKNMFTEGDNLGILQVSVSIPSVQGVVNMLFESDYRRRAYQIWEEERTEAAQEMTESARRTVGTIRTRLMKLTPMTKLYKLITHK